MLTLSRRETTALACANCGAPVTQMKPLKKRAVSQPRPLRVSDAVDARRNPPRRKRRTSGQAQFLRTLQETFEEVLDEIEDLFD